MPAIVWLVGIVPLFIIIVLLFMYINKVAKDNDPANKLLKPIEPEEEKGSFFLDMDVHRISASTFISFG